MRAQSLLLRNGKWLETLFYLVLNWFRYHTPGPSQQSFLAHSTLINGKGRFPGGPAAPLSVVNVEQGKKYRFHLISIACEANFVFSIDAHTFTAIEVDSENIEPYPTDKIQIFTGKVLY